MARTYFGDCPCHNCKNRKVGCHSNCSLYNDWTQKSVVKDVATNFSGEREFGLFAKNKKDRRDK